MMTMTYNRRQGLSLLLVLSMIFTMWLTVSPMNHADAGILSAVGNVAKSIFVNVGALAGGALTAVVGAAIGGGPLGMAIGGVAGFLATKKVLNWTTSSFANFATVAGAIGGGMLCAGMGFPMLAVGVLGGGLVSRLLVKGVSALVEKITGSSTLAVGAAEINEEAAKAESEAVMSFIQSMQSEEETVSVATPKTTVTTPVVEKRADVKDSQTAYNNYIEAYQKYVQCAQNGDAEGAKAAYEVYRSNLSLYQTLLKSGL